MKISTIKLKLIQFFIFIFILISNCNPKNQDMVFHAGQFGIANLTLPQSSANLEALVSNLENSEPILNINSITRYRRMSKYVGRLDILLSDTSNNKRDLVVCTATLIDTDKILTNYHCIPGIENNKTVIKSELRMEYLSQTITGEAFEVELPILEGDFSLDYSILRVKGNPGLKYGAIPLKIKEPTGSELLFIVHHPMGYPKRLSRQNCLSLNVPVVDNDYRHRCDTLPGSSGSLIINDETLDLMAIHKAGGATIEPTSFNSGTPMVLIKKKSSILNTLRQPETKISGSGGNSSDGITTETFTDSTEPPEGKFKPALEWIFTEGTKNYMEARLTCKNLNARLPKYDEIASSYEFSMENPNRISRIGWYWTDSYSSNPSGYLVFVHLEKIRFNFPSTSSMDFYYHTVCVKDVMKRIN